MKMMVGKKNFFHFNFLQNKTYVEIHKYFFSYDMETLNATIRRGALIKWQSREFLLKVLINYHNT